MSQYLGIGAFRVLDIWTMGPLLAQRRLAMFGGGGGVPVNTTIETGIRRAVLQWITAHCGVSENERADVLTKEGTGKEQPDNRISYSEKKSIIKTLSMSQNQLQREEEHHQGTLNAQEHAGMATTCCPDSSKLPWWAYVQVTTDWVITCIERWNCCPFQPAYVVKKTTEVPN